MECLRQVDAAQLIKLQSEFFGKILAFPFVPTVDGKFLNDVPSHIIANGQARRTELLIGTLEDEGESFFIFSLTRRLSAHS
jgi:carboxylesterase type B